MPSGDSIRGRLRGLDTGTSALVSGLLAGTVRALLLWRASIGVEVVNVVVLKALAEGRLFAATLLWLSHLRTARSIATRSYAGASSLVDSVLTSFDEVEGFAADASSRREIGR